MEEQIINTAKAKTKKSVSSKKTQEEEKNSNEDRIKNIRKAFKLPQNATLRDWMIEQIAQWRMIDKKTDYPQEVRVAVFQELLGMFQFLDTEVEEKTKDDKDNYE